MSREKVLVLGGNFGGLTAALALKHELHGDVDVTVVSASDRFLFNPSLIWLPFGKRSPDDITFELAPTFEEHGIDFVHAEATRLDLAYQAVATTAGTYPYDYLVVATGYRNDFDVAPGLGPDGNAYTITTLDEAIRAGQGWRRFLDSPGDVIVGATQGAGCFGAAYEYLFNVSHQLRKAGLKRRAKITYISAEPFLGHFGIGGLPHGEGLLRMFLKKEGITAVLDASLDHVDEGRLVLADGTKHEFAYAMIVPPFLGQEVIRQATAISDDKGYVKVRDTYQSELYDNVYAVGIAAAVAVPWQTATPIGIPKTGYPTRDSGARGGPQHCRTDPRGETPIPQGVRRHPGRLRNGCRQQRGGHPGRQDAPTPQTRGSDSRTAGACHEVGLREVLPLESPPRLCQPALMPTKTGRSERHESLSPK